MSAPGSGKRDVDHCGARLVWHGFAQVVFALFVSGVGYEVALVDKTATANQWRVAHSGGVQNGLLALGVAAAQPYLTLDPTTRSRVASALAVATWGNTIGYALGALLGVRGLTPVCISSSPPYVFCDEGMESVGNMVVNALFGVGMAAMLYVVPHVLAGAAATTHHGAKED